MFAKSDPIKSIRILSIEVNSMVVFECHVGGFAFHVGSFEISAFDVLKRIFLIPASEFKLILRNRRLEALSGFKFFKLKCFSGFSLWKQPVDR